jgi:hypothetical protein
MVCRPNLITDEVGVLFGFHVLDDTKIPPHVSEWVF